MHPARRRPSDGKRDGRANGLIGPRVGGWNAVVSAPPVEYGQAVMENHMQSGARDSSGVVLGALLVFAGMLFLLYQLGLADMAAAQWPLFVIVPGLALILVSLAGRSLGVFAIIGSIVLVTGLVLAVQNAFGVWAAWSYAWALIFPGAIGLGVAIIGAERHDRRHVERGLRMFAIGITMAVIFGMFFEGVMHVSGVVLAPAFGIVVPVFLVVFGFALLAASVLRGRSFSEQRPGGR